MDLVDLVDLGVSDSVLLHSEVGEGRLERSLEVSEVHWEASLARSL